MNIDPKKDVIVDISVLLGRARVPVQRLLKLGRGAIIELDGLADEDLTVLANNVAVAQGKVVVRGGSVGIEITRLNNVKSWANKDAAAGGDGEQAQAEGDSATPAAAKSEEEMDQDLENAQSDDSAASEDEAAEETPASAAGEGG